MRSTHTAARAAVRPAHAQVAQPGDGFEPKVLPVPLGSEVRFSANDGRRHELYAFSPARRFTFPLYAGHAEESLRFETPGVVDYGCAIHDAAIGYVVVLDTPYFATTDAGGHARLDAPDGDYTLQVWHERQARGREPLVRELHVEGHAVTRGSLPVQPLRAAGPLPEVHLHDLRERFLRFQRGG